jgi:hypothetical protein
MSRAADYSIKGFLYQFNKSLLEILNSPSNSLITLEGIVEDVEIVTPDGMTAIQCKYHEASEKFTPSGIFKPLLQMMCHFHKNTGAKIRYILFAHYPSVNSTVKPVVGKTELQAALSSTNRDFREYIAALHGSVDIDAFLDRFAIEFGAAFEDLVAQVSVALEANGIPAGDIDTLAYPNAINMVAGISVKHDPKERRVTKRQFLKALKAIRKTAISRWTLALRTRKQLLDARRKQVKTHLDKNSRLRYFVVDANSLDDYDAEIILFVGDYIDKYHFKAAHISTPVLCLLTSKENFRSIQHRLYVKGILTTDGYVGDRFEEEFFFRDPFMKRSFGGSVKRDFSLRLLRWDDHSTVLNNRKYDDLFVIGDFRFDSLNTVDVNVEHLATTSLKEVKYVIGVSNVYE